jgi:hypothetical protein
MVGQQRTSPRTAGLNREDQVCSDLTTSHFYFLAYLPEPRRTVTGAGPQRFAGPPPGVVPPGLVPAHLPPGVLPPGLAQATPPMHVPVATAVPIVQELKARRGTMSRTQCVSCVCVVCVVCG